MMKKFALLMFSVLLICTLSVPAFAADDEAVSTVTEFSYIIVDEEDNIVSTGVIPSGQSRYLVILMEEKDVQLSEQDEIIDDTPLLGKISFDEILAEIRY